MPPTVAESTHVMNSLHLGCEEGNKSHICVPIHSQTIHDMVEDARKAKSVGGTCVEFRLDFLTFPCTEDDILTLLNQRNLPSIITYRPVWEGGLYDGLEDYRLNILRKAVALGADFVDIELKAAKEFLQPSSSPTRFIVSSHNFKETPSDEDLTALVEEIKATGADIVKVATTANSITDAVRILKLISRESQTPIIAMAMGSKGQISRILGPKYGAFLTFGSLSVTKESAAIGQPSAHQLSHVYRVQGLGPATRVLGLIGNPVSHSKGYLLHNALMGKLGFDGIYLPYLVDDIEGFLEEIQDMPEFAGFSVTIPHKQTALACCQHVDPVVKSIGAINTLIRRPDGSLEGHNTDWDAAISATEDGLREREALPTCDSTSLSPLAGRLVVVVGAGGAGRALAFGAKQRGAHVAVANRSIDKARELAAAVGAEVIPLADLANADLVRAIAEKLHGEGPGFKAPVLTNTTSVGMQPNVDDTPVPQEGLSVYSAVFDAVYTPMETRLLREATALGATPVSGMEMFVRQAAAQFELFTGKPDPRALASEIVLSDFKI